MAADNFTQKEKDLIKESIRNAERATSGEVQVHIENHCSGEVLDRAAQIFKILKMHKTDLRNGVLFYLAMKDHKFAILGDAGINAKVPANFWDEIKSHMAEKFKKAQIAEGLSEGIKMAGIQLQHHFPVSKDDINELSDDISFGKN